MPRRRRSSALAAGALILLSGSACGYALVGRGTVVDPTIKRIGVPVFRDATGKPGLDQKITQKVVEELLKRGRFDVTQDRVGVDALVDGEIVKYEVSPVGFSGSAAGGTQASRYAVTVTARVRYAKIGAPEPIWSNNAFSFRDEYDVGAEAASILDREDQAVERLASAFARSLVAAMLEAF